MTPGLQQAIERLRKIVATDCEGDAVGHGSAYDRGRADMAVELLALLQPPAPPVAACLQLTRPLVFLDLETTSRKPQNAAIVEVGIFKVFPNGNADSFETLVNPGFPLPAEVAELTGLDPAEVAAAAPFEVYANQILELLRGADVAGYRVRDFDAPILSEHLARAGLFWGIRQEEIVDALELWQALEPRKLGDAVRAFCRREPTQAHRALADALDAAEALAGMLGAFGLATAPLAEVVAKSRRDQRMDLFGHFAAGPDGEVLFNFGKHAGDPASSQRGYLKWLLGEDFPADAKSIADDVLSQPRKKG